RAPARPPGSWPRSWGNGLPHTAGLGHRRLPARLRSLDLEPLVGQDELLHRDVLPRRIESGAGVLRRPRPEETPGHDHLGVVLVEELHSHGAAGPYDVAVADLAPPEAEIE